MHKPTFTVMMSGVVCYGAIKAFELFIANKFLLLAIVLFNAGLSLYGALVQPEGSDAAELMWMRFYIVPFAAWIIAGFLSGQESTNDVAMRLGFQPIYQSGVGTSSDFESVGWSAVLTPLLAAVAMLCAWFVQRVLDSRRGET